MEFKKLHKVMVVITRKNNIGNFIGLSFFDTANVCLATAMFLSPISYSHHNTAPMMMEQYIAVGVFTADILFLSTFLGHMGSTAKYPCVFCLATLQSMKTIFDSDEVYPERLLGLILESYEEYKKEYLDKPEEEQTKKLRERVTQTLTDIIFLPVLANIHMDCITRAVMHVLLGFTRVLVQIIMNFMLKVESLASEDQSHATREGIMTTLNLVKQYEQWLDTQLEGTIAAIQGQEQHISTYMSRVARTKEVLSIPSLSAERRQEWEEKLKQIESELEEWEASYGVTTDDEEHHRLQLLEQLCVTTRTRQEIEAILKKHEGLSHRILVSTLKKYGVDMKLYHEGMIIGNHCFQFAKHGTEITSEINTSMKEHISDNRLRASLDEFEIQMTVVISKWYDLMRVIKSIERLSAAQISKFQSDTNDLKNALIKLIKTDPPLSSNDNPLRYPTTRKTHLLFGKDMTKQLHHWENFGALDEENTEVGHAIFNQLKRRFGGTRGKTQKKLVFNQFLYMGAKFIRDGVKAIVGGTKAKNPAKKIKAKQPSVEHNEVDVAVRGDTDALDDFDGGDDGVNWDTLFDEVSADNDRTTSLGEFECGVNSNPALHSFMVGDRMVRSKIVVCSSCRMRFLEEALETHQHEIHSTSIAGEVDGDDE